MASSLPSRMVQVLFAPARLFDELREDPRSLWVIVVTGLMVVTVTAFIPTEAWEAMLRERMSASGGESPMDPAQMARVIRWTGVVAGALFWGVWALALGGVSTLVFVYLLGDEGSFRQYMAVAGHSMVIAALGAVLTLPLEIIEMDPQISLSLGSFAIFLDEGYLLRFLQRLDLFGLWATLVMALGVSRIDPRRGWGSAAAIFTTLFVALALVLAIPGGGG